MLTIVSATTHDERGFHDNTFLGCSLRRLRAFDIQFDLRIAFRNPIEVGLSELYDRAINEERSQQPMLLVHDDVSIEDMMIEQKLHAAFDEFDVVGVAGGNPPDNAAGWYNSHWGPSGCVGHASREQLQTLLRPN